MKKIFLFYFLPFALFFGASSVFADEVLDVTPETNVEGKKITPENKRILNQIYRNQERVYKQSKSGKKIILKKGDLPKRDLQDYNIISGTGKFDVVIKKPSKRLEKKFDLYQKAYASFSSGQYEIAVTLYEDVLKRFPTDEDAIIGLASSYHHLGDFDMAKTLYIKALEYYPKNVMAINNFIILVTNESPDQALDELLKLDKVFVNNHVIKAQIAYLYSEQGKYSDALRHIDDALDYSGGQNLQYVLNKAIIMDNLGFYKDAKKLYNKVLNYKSYGNISIPENIIRKRISEI